MARSQIALHPMNPRTIDRHARKRLRESLGRDGLVETVVVNARTGRLVSGHQRLSLLDEEAEGKDYSLDAAVIDVDEARERELLVRLNNPTSQGAYDFAALEALLRDDAVKLNPDGLGFDQMDLQVMFPEMPVSEGMAALFDKVNDKAQPDIDKLKEQKAAAKRAGKAADSAEFYVVFVGRTAAQVEAFLTAVDLPAGERFHDLARLAALLGVGLVD